MRVIVDGSQVYLACAEDVVKVGVSYNLVERSKVLRYFGGRRFEIVSAWPHRDPYAIEMMVIHSLEGMGFDRIGRECFRVSLLTAKREVGRAMRCYESHDMTNETSAKKIGDAWRFMRHIRGMRR